MQKTSEKRRRASQTAVFALAATIVWFVPSADAQSRPNGTTSSGFGGPSSVQGQMAADKSKNPSEAKNPLSPYSGLTFGGDINLMGQYASEGPGETDAAGGVLRLYGTWTLVGRGTPDTGALHFKIESRHRLGTAIPPQSLGPALGYAGLTSVGFSDAGQLLTNFFWQQSFNNDQFAFVAGIVDVTDYLDTFNLVSPWTGFGNLAFSTNPTMPAPNQGLGAAVRWRFADHYYLNAGLADANGQPDDPLGSIENLFDTGETFKHVEVGWYDTWDTRFSDNYHISVWQIDARSAAGVGSGWGAVVSGQRTIAERWTPFLRAGYADGGDALVDRSVSVGTGYTLFDGRDQLGFGFNWGRAPQGTTLAQSRDQYSAEVFYRYQPFKNLQITPDIQYLVDPAYAPGVDRIWVAGLRVRVVF